jgi:hypothetical protein
MSKRLDILVVGMDKITDKSCYIYDSFAEQGVNCLIYSRDKTGFHNEVKGRIKVDVKRGTSNCIRPTPYHCFFTRSSASHSEFRS